jgi:hypothetical protein
MTERRGFLPSDDGDDTADDGGYSRLPTLAFTIRLAVNGSADPNYRLFP